MCLPSRRTSTSFTSRSTRKCFDTEGCSNPSLITISPTDRSPVARNCNISRRRGSATALNASDVVAALAMPQRYIPIWEYVKPFFSYPIQLRRLLPQRPSSRSAQPRNLSSPSSFNSNELTDPRSLGYHRRAFVVGAIFAFEVLFAFEVGCPTLCGFCKGWGFC